MLVRRRFVGCAAAAIMQLGCGNTEAPSQSRPDGAVAPDADAGAASDAPFCERCRVSDDPAKIALPATSELSGIAASQVHDGVYYVHNDSGDTARFFAIDDSGKVRGTFAVKGATAIDWEDIAVGPCPAGSCVYLADVGDNNSVRTDYVVYRVPEPQDLPDGSAEIEGDALKLHYPDGKHNCETLLVHPKTGRLTLVTKSATGSGVYEFPETLTPGADHPLTKAAALTFPNGSPLATGGDVSARGVLLRTYTGVWFYEGTEDESAAQMLAKTPCAAAAPTEPQGEAVGWTKSGYVTVSEGAPKLNRVVCD